MARNRFEFYDRLFRILAVKEHEKLRNSFYNKEGEIRITRVTMAAITDSGFLPEWDQIYVDSHSDESAMEKFLALVSAQTQQGVAA